MGGLTKKEFTTGALADAPPVPVERDNPRDVVVTMPREIATWTAGAVTALLWLGLAWLGSMGWFTVRWPVVVFVPPIFGLVVFITLFLALSPRRLLVLFERRYNVDIDRDGYVGEPPAEYPVQRVRVDVQERTFAWGAEWQFQMTPEQTHEFLQSAFDGHTTVADMRAQGLKDRQVADAVRQLKNWALVEDVNPNDPHTGWRLTAQGRRVIYRYLEDHPLSPTDDMGG